MQLYGYKSGCIKVNGRGICWCCCCAAAERQNRGYRKRNRKRVRRWAREQIKEQI